MPVIYHYSPCTTVLGPGKRFVIWFQGCKKRCKGCINKEGQMIDKGIKITNEMLLTYIKRADSITGVTISGGEPFLQAEDLIVLIKSIKKETNLDVMVYTGYTYEELVNQHPEYKEEVFPFIDILIDGEYKEELNDNQLYRGSSNQHIYFFTQKYRSFYDKILQSKNRSIEFEMNEENELFMIGIPPKDFYLDFMDHLLERKRV